MRLLNTAYMIETINARLNGSSEEIEKSKDNFKNTTFTKKIGNRAMVSAVCQKFNIKRFQTEVFGYEQNVKTKEGKQIRLVPDPYRYASDDVFGFMMAGKVELDENDYNALEESEKINYTKSKKSYVANVTKKRFSRVQMSSLVNVSNRKVQVDFHTCGSMDYSLPYKLETYSGVMYGIGNINIDEVGKFYISNSPIEMRDYSEDEAKEMNVQEISEKEKFRRIESVLRGLEYLSIKGNQTNHLTDTKPKFVILGEYSWGNNVFQGLVNESGINLKMLREALDQNEEYRLSNVWIGINQFFDEEYNKLTEQLTTELKDYDFIKISNVHDAFNAYVEYLESTL